MRFELKQRFILNMKDRENQKFLYLNIKDLIAGKLMSVKHFGMI